MKTTGGFGKGCLAVLQKVGNALAGVDRVKPGKAIYRLKQRIQCRWMKMLGAVLANQAANCHIPQA
jgi:hypothetical protein